MYVLWTKRNQRNLFLGSVGYFFSLFGTSGCQWEKIVMPPYYQSGIQFMYSIVHSAPNNSGSTKKYLPSGSYLLVFVLFYNKYFPLSNVHTWIFLSENNLHLCGFRSHGWHVSSASNARRPSCPDLDWRHISSVPPAHPFIRRVLYQSLLLVCLFHFLRVFLELVNIWISKILFKKSTLLVSVDLLYIYEE